MTPKLVRLKDIKYHWEIYLFIVPTIILVALFQYYPTASGVIHSFYRWNGADISEFVGWKNYTDLLRNTEFWNSFKLAFILGGWNIIKMLSALFVAVAIHRCRSERMQFFYRTLFVVQMVIPGLVIVLIWRSFFFEATSGYLNQFLLKTGLFNVLARMDQAFNWGGIFVPGKMPAWLGDPKLIIPSCIIWGFPWIGSIAVLTHLAKLQNIPKDIYEAGEIDGVNWWTKFTNIELPLIMGSIYLLLVFVIIGTITDAGMILALAGIGGGPGGKATVPALFIVRKSFLEQQMGYACAVGIILTVIVMLLQKISTRFMGGEGGERTGRGGGVIKALLFVGGLAALVWTFRDRSRNLTALGSVLILLSLPYGWIARRLAPLFASKTMGGRPMMKSEADIHAERIFLRENHPLYKILRLIGQGFLRLLKHAYVWLVLVCAFLPLYLMVIVSLKNNEQFYLAPATLTHPVFWENWRTAWNMVTPTLANSLFISTSSTILSLACALSGAYFFARLRVPGSSFLWNALLILMMIPPVANLVPLFTLLRDMSLLNTLTALIIVGASGGQVFAIFVLRNFVSDVPQDLFEAGEIDGANHFQQMKMIVIPLSGPVLGMVGVQLFMGAWNDFLMPLIVMRDHARLPVMVQLIRMAGDYIKLWGPLMAGYAMASIPIIILFIFSMKLFIRGLTEGAVKG
jgi:ABC-type glycerol-3-phosphate transport system permease component